MYQYKALTSHIRDATILSQHSANGVKMTGEKQPRRSVNRRFYRQLKAELEVWKQQGIVTREQADTVLSQYVVVSPLYGKLIVTLVTLGAILAGVGVILFVSANWQEIPRVGKILLLMALVVATYLPGYWLKYERDFPRAGEALIFVGAMVFGAAIFMVGQQYHMPVDDPRLMGWWFVGVIPVAYFTRSREVLALAILAALGGLGYKTAQWLGGLRYEHYAFFAFYLVLGLALYGIGSVHSRFQRLKYCTPNYQGFGLIVLLGVMFIMSFKDIYSESALTNWDFLALPSVFTITFHIAAAIAVVCAVWCFAIDANRRHLSYKLSTDLFATIFLVVISYLALVLPFTSPAAYAVIFNIVLFAVIFGLIFLGYFRGVSSLVNIALIFFGLAVIGRYFDFAWELLPRSVFFIIGGFLLLGVGILLERLRRKTLQQMHAVEVVDESET
jgi:uncharacterized membrane protein